MEQSDGILYSYQSDSRDRVLKILAIPKEKTLTAFKEMDERTRFVNFLGSHGMDIAYPVKNKNNNVIETLEEGNYILAAYTMDKINGKIPEIHDFTNDFYIQYGKMIGKLHRLTKNYPKWRGKGTNGDLDVLSWEEEWNFFYSWCKDQEVKQAWQNKI